MGRTHGFAALSKLCVRPTPIMWQTALSWKTKGQGRPFPSWHLWHERGGEGKVCWKTVLSHVYANTGNGQMGAVTNSDSWSVALRNPHGHLEARGDREVSRGRV